jgi:hypothetical protein
MRAETTVPGIPNRKIHAMRRGPVGIRWSSSTGLMMGHHIMTATAMKVRCWTMCTVWSMRARLYQWGKCQKMKTTL